MAKEKAELFGPLCRSYSCTDWQCCPGIPAGYLSCLQRHPSLGLHSVWFNQGFLCTWMMCWAMQSCSVPLSGCSPSICACNARRQGRAVLALSWPALAFPQPAAAGRLSRKGTQLSCPDEKLLPASSAILCCCRHATSVYGHGSTNTGLQKARPSQRWPRLQEQELLGWFPDTPVSAEPGRNARHIMMASSSVVHLSSVGSQQIRPRHRLVTRLSEPGGATGRFPAALGHSSARHPCSKWALSSMESCPILKILPTQCAFPAQCGHLMVRAAPIHRWLQPRGRTRCLAALCWHPRHRAGPGKGQIEREVWLLPE